MYSCIERVTKSEPNSYQILISQEMEKGKPFCNVIAVIMQADITKILAVHLCSSVGELTDAKVNISVINAGDRVALSFKFHLQGAFRDYHVADNDRSSLSFRVNNISSFANDIYEFRLQDTFTHVEYSYLLCGTGFEMLRQAFGADDDKSVFPGNIPLTFYPTSGKLECQLVIPVQKIECAYLGE